jgi:hypothetical protein
MNVTDLRNQIDTLAWGPRGSNALKVATASPSPVAVVCAAFQDLRERTDLNESETELLRACCRMIRTNQWYGLASDAVNIEAALPPPPAPTPLETEE